MLWFFFFPFNLHPSKSPPSCMGLTSVPPQGCWRCLTSPCPPWEKSWCSFAIRVRWYSVITPWPSRPSRRKRRRPWSYWLSPWRGMSRASCPLCRTSSESSCTDLTRKSPWLDRPSTRRWRTQLPSLTRPHCHRDQGVRGVLLGERASQWTTARNHTARTTATQEEGTGVLPTWARWVLFPWFLTISEEANYTSLGYHRNSRIGNVFTCYYFYYHFLIFIIILLIEVYKPLI